MKNDKICIIGGTSLAETRLFGNFSKKAAVTKYGKINLYQKGNIFFIQRHEGNVPPHRINYRAYIQALADKGVKQIISVNSVGSLKKSLKPGVLVLPDDFISPWNTPTFFDDEIKHVCPGFDGQMREAIYKIASRLKIKVKCGGVYLQTTGPRFETPAEIKMFAKFADIVGMTLGAEAALAAEKGIVIASLCSIDNYANGVAGKVSYDIVKSGARRNQEKVEKILKAFLDIK